MGSERDTLPARLRQCLAGIVLPVALVCGLAPAAGAEERVGRTLAGFAGVLTENDWQETINPARLDLTESFLLGIALGYAWPLPDDRWSLGVEAQAVQHAGRQDHLEVNLPVVLRYHPRKPLPRRLESVAFGIGASHAFALPKVEVERLGQSRRSLIYWMAEAEFASGRKDRTWFLRLHHRSSGFGLLQPEAGSNAIVVGLRRSF